MTFCVQLLKFSTLSTKAFFVKKQKCSLDFQFVDGEAIAFRNDSLYGS